jgi:Fe2+ transport system protein B
MGDAVTSVSDATNNYINAIQANLQSQSNYISNINQKNNVILDKQEIQLNQLKEIEDKEKLLLTRSRMLQIAQDRNSYKKKIIYTLLAIIFGLFILILFIYVLFTRKTNGSRTS